MSGGIRQAAGVVKARLERYLKQVKPPDPNGDPLEQLQILEQQISQIQAAVNQLSEYERQWLQLFVNLVKDQEEREMNLMAKAQETGGFLNRLEQGREQLIILQGYVAQLRHLLSQRSASTAHPIAPVSPSLIRLPKLELRTFDGNSTRWPTFWDWYQSTIDSQPISDQQKAAYFSSCMTGPAKELIEAYQLQNPSYSEIIGRVKARYANNEIIIQQLYAQLEKIPRIQDGRQVRKLVEEIERILELLQHQGEVINNPKFQFLYDRLRIKLESDLCHIKKDLKALVRWMARIDANAAATILLERKDVVAKYDGENLVAFPCIGSKEIHLPGFPFSNKILSTVFNAPALKEQNTEVIGDLLQSLRSVEPNGITSGSRKQNIFDHVRDDGEEAITNIERSLGKTALAIESELEGILSHWKWGIILLISLLPVLAIIALCWYSQLPYFCRKLFRKGRPVKVKRVVSKANSERNLDALETTAEFTQRKREQTLESSLEIPIVKFRPLKSAGRHTPELQGR